MSRSESESDEELLEPGGSECLGDPCPSSSVGDGFVSSDGVNDETEDGVGDVGTDGASSEMGTVSVTVDN